VSGVKVVRYLLAQSSDVTAQVNADSIMAGEIPLDTDFPVIGVSQVGATRSQTVAQNGSTQLVVERVQVTVQVEPSQSGGAYPKVKELLALVRKTCRSKNGVTVNGIAVDSILSDTEGPDFTDPDTKIVSQSQDFIVRWRETL
jgi:hypothetical protein